MFNPKKQSHVNEKTYPSTNIISKDTLLRGDIEAEGSFRLEGKLIGNIKTQSKVVLAVGATLKGDIRAKSVEIGGNMEGKIEATDRLVLNKEARVKGNLNVRHLVVEVGAVFNGQCVMQSGAENATEPHKINFNAAETHAAPSPSPRTQKPSIPN